jgi:hypothetical protein
MSADRSVDHLPICLRPPHPRWSDRRRGQRKCSGQRESGGAYLFSDSYAAYFLPTGGIVDGHRQPDSWSESYRPREAGCELSTGGSLM